MHWIDWVILAGFLLATTAAGHLLRGKDSSLSVFFLGGETFPGGRFPAH